MRGVGGELAELQGLTWVYLFWSSTYSCNFLGICEQIFLPSQRFCLIFRNSKLQAFSYVNRSWSKVRWQVPTPSHRTVGQTSESDHSESASWHLKWLSCQIMRFFCQHFFQLQTQLHCNLNIWNVTRSAPSVRVSTFHPPLDTPVSALSSALWNSAVRQIG